MSETGNSVVTSDEKRARLERMLRERLRKQVRRFPLSFAQQRLWFLDQMEGGNSIAYTIPVVLCLRGNLDAGELERSVGEILRRHQVLRTTFEVNGAEGTPVQVVHPWQPPALKRVVLSSDADPWAEARNSAIEEARTPFDLAAGPLFRAALLELGGNEWVLLLTMHHIISDGWSVNVLLNELSALYGAYSQGQASPLPELPVQYTDFAHWQRERLTGDFLEQQMVFWRSQFSGTLPILELPTQGQRPNVHSLRGAVRVWRLGRSAAESAFRLARSQGVTLFMTLMTAFQILLYRYSGQEDLLIATPAANRNKREIEGLIGLFINTLVLRTDLSGDPTVRELLARVKEAALGVFSHPEVPFEKLVEELQPERDISRTPLFQVMFVLQPPMPDTKTANITITPWVLEGSTSKFEMTLSIIEEVDGGLQGWLEYNTDLFSAPMIERLISHYETILTSMADDPDRHIGSLPLLSRNEAERVLVRWNDNPSDYDLEGCVDEAVAGQTQRTPDALAVVFEDRHLTYRELGRRADDLASTLLAAGIASEEVVGICMERSLEMVVTLLGTLRAGVAYLPLDPTYPKDRLGFMLNDSRARMILTHAALADAPDWNGHPVMYVDRELTKRSRPADAPGARDRTGPEGLSYVIYTSGSTGRPKGVMTSHRGMCNLILWMQMAYPLAPGDRMIQRTAFSFDASIWEFFWPLICGATLVVASPDSQKYGDHLVRTLIEEEVTVLQLVQSLLAGLLEMEEMSQCASLRHVFCGGEAMSDAVCKRFYSGPFRAELHNVYGPTEASMHVTHWECPREGHDTIIPIGMPIGNSQLYVLDKQMQPIPIRAAGELYIGGAGLARGYFDRPDLTAERFIPNPHSTSPGERVYMTGDLARYREDAAVEFLGRIDHQVKIRGFRIELGEIESQLRQHNSIAQAVVLAREDDPGDKRLVAYVVIRPDEHVATGDLRNYLSTKLPEYMVPSEFMVLETMPVMSNGKIDRNALPAPDRTRESLPQPFVEPRNETEARIASIFGEVLKMPAVGIDDNFFMLGGHSLSATQVMIRIRDVFRREIPLRRMFETPTVAGLAMAIQETEAEEQEEDKIEIISRTGVEESGADLLSFEDVTSEDLDSFLAELAARKNR